MSHFYPLTSVSQTGYEVIDENMDGPQPAGSPANLLLSLVSRLPAHFPVIHQPPGDNGSKITNYLLQWDEVRVAPDVQPVALMLLFKLLRPISPPPPPLHHLVFSVCRERRTASSENVTSGARDTVN